MLFRSVVFRHLRPERQKLGFAAIEVGAASAKIVFVEDHLKVIGESGFHGPIERLEPGGAELIGFVHVPERLQIDANGLESAIVDQLKMALVEACLCEVVPEGIVAEDIDAPSHFLDLLERVLGSEGLGLSAQSAQDEGGEWKQPERFAENVLYHAESEA